MQKFYAVDETSDKSLINSATYISSEIASTDIKHAERIQQLYRINLPVQYVFP